MGNRKKVKAPEPEYVEGLPFRITKGWATFWVVVMVLCVIVGLTISFTVWFFAQESEVRTAWKAETGDLLGTDDTYDVAVYEADVEADISVLQIEPTEVLEEGFTYYDLDVQERLAGTISNLVAGGDSWTATQPLAILNAYGTGSNGLYLYFETDFATQVSYVIEAEGTTDYSATAAGGYVTEHEVQIIGLVPGRTNHVTITLTGSLGNVRQVVEFDIAMPETSSGYSVQLDYHDGTSDAELSSGLYVMLRTNGYLGYGFFYDNSGTLRYEMVLEGMGMDRIVEYDGDIVVCISDSRIARIDGLGRVVAVYDLGEYTLHHDINYSEEGKLIIAAEYDESDEALVEDLVLELDLETGELSLLVDFSELMSDYRTEYSRVIGLTDPMAYYVGEWDWIHINTVQYLSENDSLIVSSRETSTIIKVENVHTDPEVVWMCGNSSFWDGTSYEDLTLECLTDDLLYQYGQHTVEYAGAGDEDGVYYLRMYNNNFWALSTRDGYELSDDELEGVGTSLYALGDEVSYVYVYKIDENAGTFELVESFEVPYSSIVSSAAPSDVWLSYRLENEDEVYDMTGKTWIVNSGVAMVFGEYDEDGELIRQFSYDATLQGYRVIKYTLEGFWFAE